MLVTDFWYTRVLDPRTLALTGLTRNGVWLIEDGEVTRPLRNFRFTQAYAQALMPGNVLGVGRTRDRAARRHVLVGDAVVDGAGAAPGGVELHRRRQRLTVGDVASRVGVQRRAEAAGERGHGRRWRQHRRRAVVPGSTGGPQPANENGWQRRRPRRGAAAPSWTITVPAGQRVELGLPQRPVGRPRSSPRPRRRRSDARRRSSSPRLRARAIAVDRVAVGDVVGPPARRARAVAGGEGDGVVEEEQRRPDVRLVERVAPVLEPQQARDPQRRALVVADDPAVVVDERSRGCR